MIRTFDLLISVILLACLSPLMLLIMFLLKFTGEREIFFYQQRIGKNYKKFKLIKFATMLKNSPNIGNRTITLLNDPRILPLGNFLRKTKINELPQLFNVIKNDMSLIGPRPLTIELFNQYSPSIKKKISKLKPGLSGVGSIVFRTEEKMLKKRKNIKSFYKKIILPYKGSLEVWYYKNSKPSIYFFLIFLTIVSIFFPKSFFLENFMRGLPKPPRKLAIYF